MSFKPHTLYRLIDKAGFIKNHTSNKWIAESIEKTGNKFYLLRDDGTGGYLCALNDVSEIQEDYMHYLYHSESKFFEEVIDDETALSRSIYTEDRVKETIIGIFEDKAFFEALKLVPPSEVARIFDLRIRGTV